MRSLYVAASGMSAQQTRIDTVANNLANVGTTGYKKSREAFVDVFYQEMTHGGKSASAARIDVGAGVDLAAIEKNHSAGVLNNTGNPLDVGLNGQGMFVVESENGENLYTRDGSFSLDGDGRIVTKGGLGVGGSVSVPMEAESIRIDSDGTVRARLAGDAGDTVLGQLQIATFVNPAGLRPLGANLYAQTNESGDPILGDDDTSVVQFSLEASNVDVAEELIKMIVAQRAYELNSKVVQAADETLQTTVNLRR